MPHEQAYYKEERKKQAQLVLGPFAGMTTQINPDECEVFFHHIVGFFVIEFQVLSTTQHLLTRQWVDDLWDVAVAEIARVLHLQVSDVTRL